MELMQRRKDNNQHYYDERIETVNIQSISKMVSLLYVFRAAVLMMVLSVVFLYVDSSIQEFEWSGYSMVLLSLLGILLFSLGQLAIGRWFLVLWWVFIPPLLFFITFWITEKYSGDDEVVIAVSFLVLFTTYTLIRFVIGMSVRVSDQSRYYKVAWRNRIDRTDGLQLGWFDRARNVRNPVRFLIFLGLCLFFIPFGYTEIVSEDFSAGEDVYVRGVIALSYVATLNMFFQRMKRHAQIDASCILSADTRPLVLLLRSFVDDSVRAQRPLFYKLFLFPYLFIFKGKPIESTLATHFLRFGPFVGVANPTDKLPNYGVAKGAYPDDKWQGIVESWIVESKYIVMIAGRSEWVDWEIKTILKNGAEDKTIIYFPKESRKKMVERVDWLKKYFKGSFTKG